MTRVLTLRELNRTTLHRQLLLERAHVGVTAAVTRLAGLQAQWAPSPYVALWSRVAGFRRDALERALLRGSIVKATLMRATLHLVAAREYPYLQGAVREAVTTIRTRSVPPPQPEAVERAIALAREQGRVTRRELLRILGHEGPLSAAADATPHRELQWLLALANLEQAPEAALHSPPRVTPFRIVDLPLAPPDEGRRHLVRRYLAAFGPASRADLSTWSRVPLRNLDPALEGLPLRRFRDEDGRELLDLPRAPIVDGDAAAPVRFLPRWDSLLLAHERRDRVLRADLRRTVIAPNGDVADTFLVDGFVAGTWQVEGGRVRTAPFDPLPPRARREVEDEARRLEAFLG